MAHPRGQKRKNPPSDVEPQVSGEKLSSPPSEFRKPSEELWPFFCTFFCSYATVSSSSPSTPSHPLPLKFLVPLLWLMNPYVYWPHQPQYYMGPQQFPFTPPSYPPPSDICHPLLPVALNASYFLCNQCNHLSCINAPFIHLLHPLLHGVLP